MNCYPNYSDLGSMHLFKVKKIAGCHSHSNFPSSSRRNGHFLESHKLETTFLI